VTLELVSGFAILGVLQALCMGLSLRTRRKTLLRIIFMQANLERLITYCFFKSVFDILYHTYLHGRSTLLTVL
jgi:hypothetical protein